MSKYSKAVLAQAKHTIQQWENHGKYRQTQGDEALYDSDINGPMEVAMSKELVQLSCFLTRYETNKDLLGLALLSVMNGKIADAKLFIEDYLTRTSHAS